MHRTTIMLPEELRFRAHRRAREEGISMGELVRRALEETLSVAPPTGEGRDPLLDDTEVFQGETPEDLAKNHDAYLYDA